MIKRMLKNKLIEYRQYIEKHGQDMPEIRDWKWQSSKLSIASQASL